MSLLLLGSGVLPKIGSQSTIDADRYDSKRQEYGTVDDQTESGGIDLRNKQQHAPKWRNLLESSQQLKFQEENRAKVLQFCTLNFSQCTYSVTETESLVCVCEPCCRNLFFAGY